MTMGAGTIALVVGSLFDAAAAAAHLACIFIGAPAYRFMGAGERIVRAAQAGKFGPALVTLAVTTLLLLAAVFALSGAGLIGPLPCTRLVLVLVTAVYLGRAVAFPLLRPAFPENSQTFWIVSSGICLLIGLTHLCGLAWRWPAL